MKGLSVIIPSYNTKDLTLNCIRLAQLVLEKNDFPFELIVVDNNSTDGSGKLLLEKAGKNCKIIINKTNVGYGKATNQGLSLASYSYVLFLNSDVLMKKHINFTELFNYMESSVNIGALTVRVELPDGSIDPASHRGFPTPWRSFCYFTGLEKLLGRLKLIGQVFGGYHLTHKNLHSIHEIDSPTGAFYLMPRKLALELHGFDTRYFMYGEDLDLSYRIKQKGYSIVYYPLFTVIHCKYQSGLKHGKREDVQKKTKEFFYDAMVTFYKLHYAPKYPTVFNSFIYFAIKIKKNLI